MAPGDPRDQEGGWRLFDELPPEEQARYAGAVAALLATDPGHGRALQNQVALALVLVPALHLLAVGLGSAPLPRLVDWVPWVANLAALYAAAKHLVVVVGAPGPAAFWAEPGWRTAVRRLCLLLLAAPAVYLVWLMVDLASAPGLGMVARLPLTDGRLLGFDACVYVAMAASGMPAGVGARRWATLWFLGLLGLRLVVAV